MISENLDPGSSGDRWRHHGDIPEHSAPLIVNTDQKSCDSSPEVSHMSDPLLKTQERAKEVLKVGLERSVPRPKAVIEG